MITCFKRICFKFIEIGCFLAVSMGLLVSSASLEANFLDEFNTSNDMNDIPFASISECFVKGAIANQVQITESAIIHDHRRVSGLPSAYLRSDASGVNQYSNACALKLV